MAWRRNPRRGQGPVRRSRALFRKALALDAVASPVTLTGLDSFEEFSRTVSANNAIRSSIPSEAAIVLLDHAQGLNFILIRAALDSAE